MMTSAQDPSKRDTAGDAVARSAFYRYHCATKHTLERLHANPYGLDWANQPDPFRRYEDVPLVSLPVPQRPPPRGYFGLRSAEKSASTITLQTVADLLYTSMAISAWKEVPGRNVRWSLRVNPSSGNLHPTETHVIARDIQGLPDGCYHFRVDEFLLEARAQGGVDSILVALDDHCGLPPCSLTILLTSIFWREAWKYRDRAFRYCHHDLGHAVACVTESLTGLGFRPEYRHGFDDSFVADLLGLSETDERPGALVCAGRPIPAAELKPGGNAIQYCGRPNKLSDKVITYDSIEGVYEATRGTAPTGCADPSKLQPGADRYIPLATECGVDADFWQIVRARRSGVSFDGKTGITADQLGAVLYRATGSAPGDVMDFNHNQGGRFFTHLFLYVHRVRGIAPGIYYYDRTEHRLGLLFVGDVRRQAMQLSLQQSIASDSAVTFSMVADFAAAYTAFGERGYRAALLEAGHIGQKLYLGAEAIGVNATGIGAFFDDDVNEVLGLPTGFEVVYHFTVGKALPDKRVRQRKAYWFETEPDLGDT